MFLMLSDKDARWSTLNSPKNSIPFKKKNLKKTLFQDPHEYEDWKHDKYPHLLEVFEEFPSIVINASLLLTQLPILQSRFYSISSSPRVYPNEIHLTVAVVVYNTQSKINSLFSVIITKYQTREAHNLGEYTCRELTGIQPLLFSEKVSCEWVTLWVWDRERCWKFFFNYLRMCYSTYLHS